MTKKTEMHHTHTFDSDCLEAFDHLYAYLNGEIEDQETLDKMEHHLAHCKSCFSRAQMERELNMRMKQAGQDEVPESLKNRLKDLMDTL
ncbi:anti-sigma factor family protein [Sedimenticola sp.]|uniref:anti-sigma factor family protein n=1 Tax=Sedimenticola sp. TaxID=1940285 RepID=UPI003D0AD582